MSELNTGGLDAAEALTMEDAPTTGVPPAVPEVPESTTEDAPEDTPQETPAEAPVEGLQESAEDLPEDAQDAPVEPIQAATAPEDESGADAVPVVMSLAAAPTVLAASDALDVDDIGDVTLGRQGEHLTQTRKIDASAWLAELTGCTLLIAAIRPGENVVYLPTVTVANGVITWPITEDDTAKPGWGRAEVRAMLSGKIKKSAVFRTRVEPSLEGDGEPVTPAPPPWVQTILDSVAAAQTAATAAQAQATIAATQATTAATQATAAAAQATAAAASVAGLAGWTLTRETDESVTIDYTAP